ncbi:MAG: heat-shock protein IbpA [Gammaproteobacteria bacterium]|nr:heat-shock protein IbpA [Gammaproteobacteria bacterium]
MRKLDFAPLYRSTVGFDHLSSLLETVNRSDNTAQAFPPYNIELLEKDQYRITMAVAGFMREELDIQTEQRTLTVIGRCDETGVEHNYLHHGIAARNFERRFQLADHIEVTGAQLDFGLLHIDLAREVPEAMKPKQIPIKHGASKLVNIKEDARSVA